MAYSIVDSLEFGIYTFLYYYPNSVVVILFRAVPRKFLGGVLSLHVPTKMGVSDDMMIATPNYNDIMFDDMINHDSYT